MDRSILQRRQAHWLATLLMRALRRARTRDLGLFVPFTCVVLCGRPWRWLCSAPSGAPVVGAWPSDKFPSEETAWRDLLRQISHFLGEWFRDASGVVVLYEDGTEGEIDLALLERALESSEWTQKVSLIRAVVPEARAQRVSLFDAGKLGSVVKQLERGRRRRFQLESGDVLLSVDSEDRTWLNFSGEFQVRFFEVDGEEWLRQRRLRKEMAVAASERLLESLKELFHRSLSRGLGLRELLDHFSPNSRGWVGLDGFRAGLVNVGLLPQTDTEEVVTAALRKISVTGSKAFDLIDLAHFLHDVLSGQWAQSRVERGGTPREIFARKERNLKLIEFGSAAETPRHLGYASNRPEMLEKQMRLGAHTRFVQFQGGLALPYRLRRGERIGRSLLVIIPDVWDSLEDMEKLWRRLLLTGKDEEEADEKEIDVLMIGIAGAEASLIPNGAQPTLEFQATCIARVVLRVVDCAVTQNVCVLASGLGAAAFAFFAKKFRYDGLCRDFLMRVRVAVYVGGLPCKETVNRSTIARAIELVKDANLTPLDKAETLSRVLRSDPSHDAGHEDRLAEVLSLVDADVLAKVLEGAMKSTGLEDALRASQFPLVLVNPNKDAFVLSSAQRSIVSSLNFRPLREYSGADQNYVGWLQGGHDLLCTRRSFVLGLLKVLLRDLGLLSDREEGPPPIFKPTQAEMYLETQALVEEQDRTFMQAEDHDCVLAALEAESKSSDEEVLSPSGERHKKHRRLRAGRQSLEADQQAEDTLSKLRLRAEGRRLRKAKAMQSLQAAMDEQSTEDPASLAKKALYLSLNFFDAFSSHVVAKRRTLDVKKRLSNASSAYYAARTDARKLRRALDLLNAGSMLKALRPSTQELDEVQSRLAAKMEESAVLKHRKQEFDAFLPQVEEVDDRLGEEVQRWKTAFFTNIDVVDDAVVALRAALGTSVGEYEKVQQEASQLKKRRGAHKGRLATLTAEMSKLMSHSLEFFDTCVWNPGVLQRVPTASLKQHIADDIAKVQASLRKDEEAAKDAERLLVTLFEQQKTLDTKVRHMEDLVGLLRHAGDVLERLDTSAMIESSFHEENAAEKASTEEDDADVDVSAMRVRLKPRESRSLEERRWVAMDLMVFPKLYKHVTEIDAEEMKFDSDYRTHLTKGDVLRLLDLPSAINLALPYLHSQDEIDAHRLLHKFSHGAFRDANKRGDRKARQAKQKSALKRRKCAELRALVQSEIDSERSLQVQVDATMHPNIYAADAKTCAEQPELLHEILREPDVKLPGSLAEVARVCVDLYDDGDPYGVVRMQRTALKPLADFARLAADLGLQGDGSAVAAAPLRLRVDWETVHPGSVGEANRNGEVSVARVHPSHPWFFAAVAGLEPDLSEDPLDIFLEPPTALPGTKVLSKALRVVSSLEDIDDSASPGEVIVLADESQSNSVLYEDGKRRLSRGQSRRHDFEVPHAGKYIQMLVATVIFGGTFENDVYNLGRMAAAMFRGSEAVGVAPVDLQCLNTADTFGRLVIHVTPTHGQLAPGRYSLVVGAVSDVSYGVQVSGKVLLLAANVVQEKLCRALELSTKVAEFERRKEEATQTRRLALKKLRVVQDLLDEADAESRTIQDAIDENHLELCADDEAAELEDEEREEIRQDNVLLETEFRHWCKIYASRCKERQVVRHEVVDIDATAERDTDAVEELLSELKSLRDILPKAFSRVFGMRRGVEVALQLNADLAKIGTAELWDSGVVGAVIEDVETPAEKVRRKHRESGVDALDRDELMWITFDMSRDPKRYGWATASAAKALTYMPRLSQTLKPFHMSAENAQRVLSAPLSDLTRNEQRIRKLQQRFHDDPRLLKMKPRRQERNMAALFLPQSVRAKHPVTRTREEEEWCTIDRKVFPRLWTTGRGTIRGVRVATAAEKRAYYSSNAMLLDELDEGTSRLPWECPLSRDKIVSIWREASNEVGTGRKKETENERRTRTLLLRFYGPFEIYQEVFDASKVVDRKVNRHGGAVRLDVSQHEVAADVDQRCRELQDELEKAQHNPNELMNSYALHASPQRFNVKLLKLLLEKEVDRMLREQVFERERVLNFLALESGDHGDADAEEKAEILVADSDSEPEETAVAETYCRACLSDICEWYSCIEVEKVSRRIEDLLAESRRIRGLLEDGHEEVESFIALSHLRGGSHWFYPDDLVAEMADEVQVLHERLRLHDLDKDLHDAYKNTRPYFSCSSVHSYPVLMSSANAKRVLNRERNFLMARAIAVDVVDELVEKMGASWLFGEPSPRLGNVPPEERIGLIQKAPARIFLDERNARINHHARQARGSVFEKLSPINQAALMRQQQGELLNVTTEREDLLSLTEATQKFGTFILALRFFRSMKLLQREKESWGDENTKLKKEGIPITKERRAMALADRNRRNRAALMRRFDQLAASGTKRKRDRKEAEMRSLKARLKSRVHRERLQKVGAIELQRVYRGYCGRKRAKRWAQKKAEIEAMKKLLSSSCIQIQRVVRGFFARQAAHEARMELAEFIAMIRLEEAIADEDEYWKTHRLKRFMRDLDESLQRTKTQMRGRYEKINMSARMNTS